MKRIFLDTNFLADYLIREEYRKSAEAVLRYGEQNGLKFYISFLSVANFAYIMRKSDKDELYGFLGDMCRYFNVTDNNKRHIEKAIALDAKDFEDALQYVTAIDSKCDCIITRNQKDFYFSKVPVYSAVEFLEHHH